MVASTQLQALDFSKYLHGNEFERLELARAVVECLKNHGFVKLVNHGIPEQTVKAYQQGTKALFDLPQGAKQKIENVKGPHPQRGWSQKGAEVTAKLYEGNLIDGDGNDLKDEREFFDAGPPSDSQYPNKWPTEDLPSFQPIMEQCYGLLQTASLQIVESMELGLSLPKGTLLERCVPASSEIRLNHYPPVSLKTLRNTKVKRTWPHTDFGIITLLFQDTVGGLEMEDRAQPGTFIPVMPSNENAPSELVVNISDTFERWTNGYIRAGLHRVDIPRHMREMEEGLCPTRYSSIFFFKATRETSAGPLPAFVTPERPAKFDNITALEFQQRQTSRLY